MKKFILLLIIAFNLFAINVFGATESVEYSFTITEGKRWNLETGIIQDDARFTITNRAKIQPSTNNRIEFDGLLFHHILFYDRFNNYLGYYNSPFSILELGEKYLGQLQDNYVDIPLTASSFSLMNYSANANEYLTEYGLDQLENPITLNDLFLNGSIEKNLGLNMLNNSNIEIFTSPSISFVENSIDFGYDEPSNSHYILANPNPAWFNPPFFISDILYGMKINTFEVTPGNTYYLTFDDIAGNILDKDEDIYIRVLAGSFNLELFKIYDAATDTITNSFEYVADTEFTQLNLRLYFNIRVNDGLTDLQITDLQFNDGYDTPITFYHNDLDLLDADFLTLEQLLDLYLDYELFRNPNSVRYEELGYISLTNFFENSNFIENADGNTIIYGRSTSFNNLFLDTQPTRNLFNHETATLAPENSVFYESYLSDLMPIEYFTNYVFGGFDRTLLLKDGVFPGTYQSYVINLYDENQNLITTRNATYSSISGRYFYRNTFILVSGNEVMPSYMSVRTSISDLDTFIVTKSDPSTYELGLEPDTILNDINNLRTDGTISDSISTINDEIILNRNVGYLENNDDPLIDLNGYTLNNVYDENIPGKNLFNLYTDYNFTGGGDETFSFNGTQLIVNGSFFVGKEINVIPNTDYFISYIAVSGTQYNNVAIWSENFGSNIRNTVGTFNTGSNDKILILFYSGAGTAGTSVYDNIQLEKGTTATPYEPYYIDLPGGSTGTKLANTASFPNDNYVEDFNNRTRYVVNKDQVTGTTRIPELNGMTLNELFNDNLMINNNDFTNGLTNWNLTTDAFASVNDNILELYTLQFRYIENNFGNGHDGDLFYTNIKYKTTSTTWRVGINASIENYQPLSNPTNFINQSFIQTAGSGTSVVLIIDFGTSQTPIYVDYVNVYNLTDLGLNHLTKETLDMYFEAYQEIQNVGFANVTFQEPYYIDLTWRLENYYNGLYLLAVDFVRFRDYYFYFENNQDPFYYAYVNSYQINLTDKLELYYEAALSLTELNEVKALYDNILAGDNPYALGLQIIGGKRYYSMPDDYLIALDLLNVDETLTNNELQAYYQEYVDNLEIEATLYLNILGSGSFNLANPQYDREIPEPSELDTDAPGFLENVLLDNLGFNNVIGRTILAIAVIFGAMFLLASLNMPSSVIIGVGAMLYVGLSFIGWVPAWITIIIALVILVLLIFKFTGKGGGSNETDS